MRCMHILTSVQEDDAFLFYVSKHDEGQDENFFFLGAKFGHFASQIHNEFCIDVL